MGLNTGVNWTDHTWNTWIACHKVSPGCKLCYMYRDMKRYGRNPNEVKRTSDATFYAPLKSPKWKKPAKVFTCSWSDFFIEEADEWRNDAWDVIRRTPHLTYQILTKRPERIKEHLPEDWGRGWDNVWLGASVENQKYANERIPILLSIPAKVRWLSCEPLLGPLELDKIPCPHGPHANEGKKKGYCAFCCNDCIDSLIGFITPLSEGLINWVVAGGESGAKDKIRLADPDWFRSLRDQCEAAGVAFWFKQHGGSSRIDGEWGGRLLDGRTWDEMPQVMIGV